MTLTDVGSSAPAAGVTEPVVRRALDAVLDPELDEPVTDLGFVRSVSVRGAAGKQEVEVHLRLPTSFCSPSLAYLMASDAKDALQAVEGVTRVVVELDDHHDSDLVNRGLAADLGYLGTFGHEAERDLEGLRATFRRKAHTAAAERCLSALLRADPALDEAALGEVTLGDLPDAPATTALLRRRRALGLGTEPGSPVLVDDEGRGVPPEEVPLRLRRARATRVSLDGNAHFCRGLLATRYPGAEADQAPRVDGAEPAFVPLADLRTVSPAHSLTEGKEHHR
jgi:metal-sulfur cluster biosynthetic enzyme